MRKTTAIGASLLLAAGLAIGLTGPASALPATHGWGGSSDDRDRWGDSDWGNGEWDSRVGERWDGGSGYYGGERYDWPDETRNYDGNVCPDMDVAKTDVSGDKKTITLIAPEGKLISAYCVKAGSYNRGEGPKVVELPEPLAEVTIAYTVGGKCRDISHYSVAYVDAPTSPSTPSTPSTPTPSPTPSEETPTETVENPTDETDEPTEETPAPNTPDTTDEDGDDDGTEVIQLPEPTPSASEAAPAGNDTDDTNDSGPVTRTVIEGAPVAAQADELAMTGPQVAAVALAALALVGVGVGAVMAARRRRAQQA